MKVTILADSVNAVTRDRITTFLLEGFPKWLVAELNTHRVLSRNSSSSRAIPSRKIYRQVTFSPFSPVYWGKNKKGMTAREELTGWRLRVAKALHRVASAAPIICSFLASRIGLHKQITNRWLEPWMKTSVVITATQWENFYRLRVHPDAQPELQFFALEMLKAQAKNTPVELQSGEWHIPYQDEFTDSLNLENQLKVCTARLARLSYLNFYGTNSLEEDIKLHDDLLKDGHMSPFEHCARAADGPVQSGNFRSFIQYRKMFIGESRDNGSPFDPVKLLEELRN